MSGGRWQYADSQFCEEIFGYGIHPVYSLGSDEHKRYCKIARLRNPLEDKIISELLYDMFCLLHSYDWYASYDTGEETYRADVKAFKKKWLKLISAERIQEMIDETIEQERTELYKALGIDDVNGE